MNPVYIRIKAALRALGVKLQGHTWLVKAERCPGRYMVFRDDDYYGSWDDNKKTFVD